LSVLLNKEQTLNKKKIKKSSKHALDSGMKIMAQEMLRITSKATVSYAPVVDDIIVSGCKDRRHIEAALDGMLDFCWDKTMLELFRKLCKYYYNINPQSTSEYILAYRELWDSK